MRRVRLGEWREYRRLRLEALQDSPTAYLERYETSRVQPDGWWQDRVDRAATDGGVAMFVAEDGGEFIGKATARMTGDGRAEIVGVYVPPAHRGTGVAEAVVRAAVEWALGDGGAKRVTLWVVDDNLRAAAFYRRLGFTMTGDTEPYEHDPRLAELEMEFSG